MDLDQLRRHPVVEDLLLTLAFVVAGILLLLLDIPGRPQVGPWDGPVAALALIGVLARRRWTVVALVGVVALALALSILQHSENPLVTGIIAVLIHTYAIGADRRRSWILAASAAAVLVAGQLIWAGTTADMLGTIAWLGVGVAVGDATRSRRAYVAEVERRARHAEQSRDEEAQLRVAQERVRIARELHDVVAHHIAAVKVQASGARNILTHRPEQVAPALENISRLSDTVLRELASVVGLLRRPGGRDTLVVEPVPGLAQLAGLLDDFGAAGLRVEHQQRGSTRELPALADLAAYRIIQEGLTNAQKYGGGLARLTVAYTSGGITVDISNAIGARPADPDSGFGILGMGERVAANGGAFTAGPSGDGGYRLHVELTAPAR
ncbi:histidine kinase [Actinoplanes sp. NBRC 103695]|uniref:sensor histidine kinase n=1 Tax=Actinoplanes sp. NBRC 103695 TaxID=3032202 RepID=UPI0025560EFF|nr:histidine kinase [Actinoplanes sp. NBRC 103695]